MDFQEKLDRAKTGSRAAYESLCLAPLDKLYSSALIALKNESEARSAVISAVKDGYSGISRIKDERHLRSWLAHELTKNIVDRLKQYRAGGVTHKASGTFEAAEKLPDVERLLFALNASFGYNSRELSILTGMSADTVNEKLASARSRLGAASRDLCGAAASLTAPEELRERYSSFDESLARLEQQKKTQREKSDAAEQEVSDDKKTEGTVGMPEDRNDADDAEKDNNDGTTPEPEPEHTVEIALPSHSDIGEEVFSDPEEEPVFEAPEPEQITDEKGEIPENMLNAKTFIAVVSAERMKGSEFLRLIGNTRISNSAYREIEQNPHLTKKRLIELLEQSPLTENDYYKLFTAVKDRRDILNAKEENRIALEKAGLYDGSRREKYKRRHREKPKTELQMAIGITEQKPVQPLTFDEGKMPEDDLDYQLQNHTGTFRAPKEHSANSDADKSSLEAAVSGDSDNSSAEDPLSHSMLHNIFDEHNDEPIDPFAAIAAEETGEQAKPGRLDEQRVKWQSRREEKVSAVELPVGATVEFNAGINTDDADDTDYKAEYTATGMPQSADDAGTDEPSRNAGQMQEETPEENDEPGTAVKHEEAPTLSSFISDAKEEPEISGTAPITLPIEKNETVTGYDPFAAYDHDDDDDEISTLPLHKNVSVTQLINEPDSGDANGPVIPAKSGVGYSPDTGLIFDAASDSLGGEEESLEFSFSGPDFSDTIPISIGDIADRDEEEDTPYPVDSYSERRYPVPDAGASRQKDGEDLSETSAEPDILRPDDSKAEERPEPFRVKPKETAAAPVRLPEDEGNPEADGDFDEAPARERYKGNEYFVDDDEYYDGVNRGKIITCAVLAVLLAAGSAGMKFLPGTSEAAVSEPAAVQTVVSGENEAPGEITEPAETAEPDDDAADALPEVSLAKLSSYDEMNSDKYKGSLRSEEPYGSDGYLRASGAPLNTDLVRDIANNGIVFSDGTAYIYSSAAGALRAVRLDAEPEEEDTDTDESVEEPDLPDKITVPEGAMHAFTSIDGDLYVISDKLIDDTHYNKFETQISVYAPDLSKKAEYILGGGYEGAVINDGKLTVAAGFRTDKAAPLMSDGLLAAKSPYFKENGELHEIPASDIYAISGAKHNAVHILYTAGGSAVGVLGGCADGMNSQERMTVTEKGIMLVAVDDGVTYSVELSGELVPEDAEAYRGEAFGTVCVGQGGMIGMNSSGCLTAYKGGKTITIPNETAKAAAWSESGTAYVVTENKEGQKMLYGFDMSGDKPAGATINAGDIYTDKLIKAGSHLAGLRAEPSPDGERAGLRLSLYDYDGSLKEAAYSIIELDKDTPRENLKYLSSPAEHDIETLSCDESGTLFAVPTVYFDGYSEVERVVVLKYDGKVFTQVGEHIAYDEKSSVLCPVIFNGKVYVITDTGSVEINISDSSAG